MEIPPPTSSFPTPQTPTPEDAAAFESAMNEFTGTVYTRLISIMQSRLSEIREDLKQN